MLFVVVGGTVAACNDGTDYGHLSLGDPSADAGATTLSTGSGTCTPGAAAATGEKLDPSTLPPCAPACGGAHCVPTDKVPAVARASFAACGGGLCVPDPLIRSGGAKPPSCKSLNGAEGVCLSTCVPEVGKHSDALPRSSCAGDERCAPCIDPNTNQPTGACAIGAPAPADCSSTAAPGATAPSGGPAPKCPHDGPPVLDPSTLPVCGGPSGGAHCLPTSLVTPPSMTAHLTPCLGNAGYCVPDKLIVTGGRFIPKTCASTAGTEGRCQSVVLPEVNAQMASLPVAGCDPNERCVPCTNPLDGTDTGACRTSCDPGPQSTPVVFASCCSARGKCLPQNLVPQDTKQYLQSLSCGAGSLCAPSENIAPGFSPPQCTAPGFLGIEYSGVCLSKCLALDTSSLSQGTCDGDHICVSCNYPSGERTGAPGCP